MERRLGKGLDALILSDPSKAKEKVEKLQLKDIVPNPFQPRKRFDEETMSELVDSIREKGVIQPILVRAAGSGYELIAGERRWRAAQELKLEEIPAIIKRDIGDVDSLEISLIENIQREELNPIEEANAYRDLIDQFSYTLEKVGLMVGKDKTTVSNGLRLLTLPEEIKKHIEEGEITTGHAKALLAIPGDIRKKRLANTIITKGISVREIERIAAGRTPNRIKQKQNVDPESVNLEEELQHRFGTKVSILKGKKRGKIEIQFFSLEDLQRILRVIFPA